jgi:UDP-3-O-[3-hydroxymyristoyl] N-acetylglucosamine deacetylase
MRRTTVAQTLVIEGIGLHKGGEIELHLNPSDAGICFFKDGVKIPVVPGNVVDTRLNTTIGAHGVRISTIEHLMSALYGLGITDCEIVVKGDEIPAMDGSALPFVERIRLSGLKGLGDEITPIVVKESLRVEQGDSWVEVVPGDFSVSYAIDFSEQAIGSQHYKFNGKEYIMEIAPARTFGLLKDVEMMRSLGLALGGGLHNAVVVDGQKVLNPEGVRFADEFVRHKILDILGDLWTLGAPIMGRVRAYKANHGLHIELARKIYALYRSRE